MFDPPLSPDPAAKAKVLAHRIRSAKSEIDKSRKAHEGIEAFWLKKIAEWRGLCPHVQKTHHMGAFPGESYDECRDCGWRSDA